MNPEVSLEKMYIFQYLLEMDVSVYPDTVIVRIDGNWVIFMRNIG